jgi:pimeloyl-ACP methyl ester carboxylesterase
MSDFSYDATSRVLKDAVGDIHYHEAGEGPALLLLHGSGPGVTGWANFENNLPVFAPHFRTFILDLPGYGGSAPVAGNPMTVSAEAVIRFMDAMDIAKAHILGNSLGGIVGSMDELVESRWRQATEPVTLASSRLLYSRAAMKAISDMTHGPHAAQTFAHLASIQAPTLITWGRDDRVSSLDRAFIALRLISHAELHVFPNCGHWAMIERKAEFESVVLAFLTRA